MQPTQQRIQQTKEQLRATFLEHVFHEFDEAILNLSPEGRDEKYTKMLESPFRFFRGSAYLFYADHATMPSLYHTPDEYPAWIQGDLHMDNFGAFQNEAGELVYDINDFDEGYIGSYLYDIIRMSVSIALYTETEGYRGEQQAHFIDTFIHAYVKQLQRFVANKEDPMALRFTQDNTTGPIKKVLKKLEKRKEHHLLADITFVDEHGHRNFVWSDEVEQVSPEERSAIQQAISEYRVQLSDESRAAIQIHHIQSLARKHGTGTASIGLDRYYALVEGERDASGREDLVLEIKEVRAAIPAYFLPYRDAFWARYAHQGHRVIRTQKIMHHLEDPYLGYVTMNEREFYIRERSPYKKKVKPKNYKDATDYEKTLTIMGKITAKCHSRAAVALQQVVEYRSEEEILRAIRDVASFSHYITVHALSYKERVKKDYELFQQFVARR